MMASSHFQNLVQYLQHFASQCPAKPAYIFLENGEEESLRVSYADLLHRATRVAALLSRHCHPGDRAILTYQPGVEFVECFWGCLLAGVVAVPVYPPTGPKDWPRFVKIALDAEAAIICTTQVLAQVAAAGLGMTPALQGLAVVVTDQSGGDVSDWRGQILDAGMNAFLQYTSGSTGNPKGVVLSHRNLVHNESLIRKAYQLNEQTVTVCWLPQYHDMGLIGNLLSSVFNGFTAVIMSPLDFLQKPVRWLRAISRYQATVSGGPNFSYELCLRRITDADLEAPDRTSLGLKGLDLKSLDLKSWTVAYNGAEPVRPTTLQRFTDRFAACGFRGGAFMPVYGLAEATLLVTHASSSPTTACVARHFAGESLQAHRPVAVDSATAGARCLVSSGRAIDQDVRIVDPETCVALDALQVGEIWIRGGSVAQGYWKNPQATAATFQARINPDGDGPWLRTGDLGFLDGGELFVTGRHKELIILDGRNFYPQDIEDLIQHDRAPFRRGCGAAFAVERDNAEALVVVQELANNIEVDADSLRDLAAAALADVAEQFHVAVQELVLVAQGVVQKTSSGKIRRSRMQELYCSQQLAVVACFDAVALRAAPAVVVCPPASGAVPAATRCGYEDIIAELLAGALDISLRQIDVKAHFSHFGLDSKALAGLSGELAERIGRPVSPRVFYDYPDIAALARFLSGEVAVVHEPTQLQALDEPIAIIGLACRLPGGADSADRFWQLLMEGGDAISETPASRWRNQDYYDPDPVAPGKMTTRWGGYVADERLFDAAFFSISPREAAVMDPQQRFLLETSWHALENAQIPHDRVKGENVGVFVGISNCDYDRLCLRYGASAEAHAGTGNAFSIAANRISYFFDWTGPSIAIDTACSSSLVALHQACESLRQGESAMALAAAVNLILTPDLTITFSKARMMAADGRCKTFDDSADGYVRGEGCGVLVLKRLSDAQRDNDKVLAIVKGSGISQDGRSNGLTAPNGAAQERAIRNALKKAGVAPESVQYVEAHGTGTPLGDPIEVDALARVYNTRRRSPLLLGSVKTNIGHLEAAAGMAGVIKTVLAMQHGMIPPQLHFRNPNHHVDWAGNGIEVVKAATPWRTEPGMPRRAGVSSFGFGGTNAHVILEEWAVSDQRLTALDEAASEDLPQVVCFSARNRAALEQLITQHQNWLQLNTQVAFATYCQTQNLARSHLEERVAFVSSAADSLLRAMKQFARQGRAADCHGGRPEKNPGSPRVAFLFTGQGAQMPGMGHELYGRYPLFRALIDECHQCLAAISAIDLKRFLLVHDDEQLAAELNETVNTQPALFCFEYALARLWQSWGVNPQWVLGHSVGEYVAAAIAGVFDLADAIKLIYHRGRLMQALEEKGSMLAVFAHREDVLTCLENYGECVSVAALNSPGQVVLSGRVAALEQLAELLGSRNIETRPLAVSHGFHSPLMQPMLADFRAVAATINFQVPQIAIISNVTGTVIGADIACADYWCQHVVAPVLFQRSLTLAQQQGADFFLEMGPRAILTALAQRSIDGSCATLVASLTGKGQELRELSHAVARFYADGGNLDWSGFQGSRSLLPLALPQYPFQRQLCWIDQRKDAQAPEHQINYVADNRHFHPLLGQRLYSPLLQAGEMQFESYLGLENPALLTEFRSGDRIYLSNTSYMEMMLEAGAEAFGTSQLCILDLQIHKEIAIHSGETRPIHTLVERLATNEIRLKCYTLDDEADAAHADSQWVLLSSSSIRTADSGARPRVNAIARLRERLQQQIDPHYFYESCRDLGLFYVAGGFNALQSIAIDTTEVLAQIDLKKARDSQVSDLWINAGGVHALYQTMGVICEFTPSMTPPDSGEPATIEARGRHGAEYVPVRVRKLEIFANVPKTSWIHARKTGQWENSDKYIEMDLTWYDDNGQVVLLMDGVQLRARAREPVNLADRLRQCDRNTRISELEQLLATQLAQGLRCPADSIRLDATIAELGVDSIVAMDVMVRLKHQLELDIQVPVMQKAGTLRAFAQVLADLIGKDTSTGNNQYGDALVQLQQGRPGSVPLVLVHPVGGTVFCYTELVRALGPDISVFAFQTVMPVEHLQQTRLEELAQHYVTHLKALQPVGPYFLGGWSLGATIALEMANQLWRAGDSVAPVQMIDGIAPLVAQLHAGEQGRFLLKLLALDVGLTAEQAEALSSTGDVSTGLGRVLQEARHSGKLSDLINDQTLQQRFEIMLAHAAMVSGYVAEKNDTRIQVYRAEHPFAEFSGVDVLQVWDEQAGYITGVNTLSGDHYSILRGINVITLASFIRKQMRISGLMPNRFLTENPLVLSAVVSNIALADNQQTATATLLIDEAHPYFFDHELDHVPGMLLFAGAWEMLCSLTTYSDPLDSARRRRLLACKTAFQRFSEKNLPVTYRMRWEKGGFDWISFHCTAWQDGRELCTFDIDVLYEKETSLQRQEQPCHSVDSSADPVLLHKQRAENVLITQIANAQGQWQCAPLYPDARHYLAGITTLHGTLTPLLLLEISRQFLTFVSHQDQAVALGTHVNLLESAVQVHKEFAWNNDIHLRLATTGENLQQDAFERFTVEWCDGSQLLARVDIVAQVALKETYRRQRGFLKH